MGSFASGFYFQLELNLREYKGQKTRLKERAGRVHVEGRECVWDGPLVCMLRNPRNIERRLVAASRKEKAKGAKVQCFLPVVVSLSAGRWAEPRRWAEASASAVEETQASLSLLFLSSSSPPPPPPSVGGWRQAAPSPPHTTVLTDGSDKLSWPVMSVGGYCCRFFLQTLTAAKASCICFPRASLWRL